MGQRARQIKDVQDYVVMSCSNAGSFVASVEVFCVAERLWYTLL